jgi:phospholipid/cholesterol/gamma-HCH transport system substrate-binding protein
MQARRIGLAVVGSAIALMLALTGFVVARNGLVGTWDYHVRVRITDADGLVEGNRVAVAGVPAGRILDLRVADHAAVLTLGISDDVRPLLGDTTTVIRPKGLAGERYIELTPGTHGSPVPDYGVLPATTTTPVEVEDVLDAFDAPTRAGLRTLLTQLGAGMAGNGEVANHDLGELLALVDQAQGLSTALQAQDDHIGSLLDSLDSIVSALAGLQASDGTIDRFVANSAAVASAVAARDAELRSLLTRLTTVLDELTAALAGHEGRFRDAIARLPALETRLQGLLAATDPALSTVAATLPTLQQDLIQLADGVWSPFLDANRLVVTATGSPQALSLPPGVAAPPGAASRAQVMQFLTGAR